MLKKVYTYDEIHDVLDFIVMKAEMNEELDSDCDTITSLFYYLDEYKSNTVTIEESK